MHPDFIDFYYETGLRIRNFRQERNLSVEELSDMADISMKYLYQIENGNVCFSTKILQSIAKALDVSSDDIIMNEKPSVEHDILLKLTGVFTEEEKQYLRQMLLRTLIKDLESPEQTE
ncbi:MAG: helix-turn-helix domain-containing protein [Clostridiaceae bacterium]|nr:helix-turn-helix domain-containing protein [Clostridiaceae bacterium]